MLFEAGNTMDAKNDNPKTEQFCMLFIKINFMPKVLMLCLPSQMY